MNKGTYNYTIETYGLFKNVDRSLLNTNTFIEKFGYRFIVVNLEDFEKSFSDLLSFPKSFEAEVTYLLEPSGLKISKEFMNALSNSNFFGHTIHQSKEVILLKKIEDFEQEVINNTIEHSVAFQSFGKLQNFIDNLIKQFRLFKSGDITCPTMFQITKESRMVVSRTGTVSGKYYGMADFSLTDVEIEILASTFKEQIEINPLTELAFSNLALSYETADIKTRYLVLMTCLESLFNQGKDQITHTVSRHLALILSQTEEEFNLNYYRVKKLYHLRSTIVHGDTPKENVSEAIDMLQNIVREAINYCLKENKTKKELFDALNVMGFGKGTS